MRYKQFTFWALCAFLAVLQVPSVHGQLAPGYLVTPLGTLPGDSSSIAYGINDFGHIVGVSRDAGGNNTLAGFLWTNGGLTDLGLYTGHTAIRPWAINNLGNITGRATNGPGGSNFGVYHNGTGWTLAGNVGGSRGNGFGINDANHMVGNMRLPSNDFSRAFVWSPGGGTVELPTLHPDDPFNAVPAYNGYEGGSYATGINDLGVVVGSAGLSDSHGTDRGFRWTMSGGMVNLGTPASQGLPGLGLFTQSYAQNINNAGMIVGAADRGSGLTRAVYWDTLDQIHDIGTLGGTSGWAYGVNESGTVVGISTDSANNSRAFGWHGGSLVDLNTLLPPGSGWTLMRAYDINEAGQIVGEGTFNGVNQGFVLTPIPEPSICIAVCVVLAGLAFFHGLCRKSAS
ncbi:MAG: hypothetical protein SFX18_05715 [Pirellulales bacterium]|nr:hypothetical protein [Pirellulales bacterium]